MLIQLCSWWHLVLQLREAFLQAHLSVLQCLHQQNARPIMPNDAFLIAVVWDMELQLRKLRHCSCLMGEVLNKMWPTGFRPGGTINRIKRSRNNLDGLKDDEGNLSAYLKKRKNCVIKPQYELIELSVWHNIRASFRAS